MKKPILKLESTVYPSKDLIISSSWEPINWRGFNFVHKENIKDELLFEALKNISELLPLYSNWNKSNLLFELESLINELIWRYEYLNNFKNN